MEHERKVIIASWMTHGIDGPGVPLDLEMYPWELEVVSKSVFDQISHQANWGRWTHVTVEGVQLGASADHWARRIEQQLEYIARYKGNRPEVIQNAIDVLEYCQEKYFTLTEPNNHTNVSLKKGGHDTIGIP